MTNRSCRYPPRGAARDCSGEGILQTLRRLVCLVVFVAGCGGSENVEPPQIVDGSIDLSKWDFRYDGAVELAGEWYFKWGELVPATTWGDLDDALPLRAPVPRDWDLVPHALSANGYLPRQGAATYALKLMVSPQERLAVSFPWLTSAGDLVALRSDGVSLASYRKGNVSLNAEEEVPVRSVVPTLMIVPPLGQPMDRPFEVTLHVKVSNHHYPYGGIRGPPVIDRVPSVEKEILGTTLRASATLGILFIVGFYHLMVYRARREDVAALFFGGLCLSFGLRELAMSGFLPRLEWGMSIEGFIWIVRAEFFAVPVMVSFVGLFINAMLPNDTFFRFIKLWGIVMGAVLALVILVTSPDFFARWRILNQIHIVVAIVGCFIHLGLELYRGTTLAPAVSFGFGVIAIGAVNDILYSKDIVTTGFVAPYTIIAFVLIQSGVLARRNASAHQKAERLGENLQEEVRLQTIELRAQTDAAMNAKDAAQAAQAESERLRENALEDAKKLRALDHQKTAFFQNMSHELRTPLTLILGPLEAEVDRAPANENLSIAQKNAMRLLRLVNQLLDFQKLSAGRAQLVLEPLNLNQFLIVIGDYFRSASSSKDIMISLTHNGEPLSGDELVSIDGEVDALEKVAFNFLSNALKYTPSGGRIELGVRTTSTDATLFVTDSGPGIAPQDQGKLFQVFSQLESGTTREYEGTGLLGLGQIAGRRDAWPGLG